MKVLALIVLALVVLASSVALAVGIGAAYTIIYDTTGTASCTNYVGFARTTENTSGTTSTNDTAWKIIATVLDADGNAVSVKHAYGDGVGDNSLWSNAWTNRVSATYK